MVDRGAGRVVDGARRVPARSARPTDGRVAVADPGHRHQVRPHRRGLARGVSAEAPRVDAGLGIVSRRVPVLSGAPPSKPPSSEVSRSAEAPEPGPPSGSGSGSGSPAASSPAAIASDRASSSRLPLSNGSRRRRCGSASSTATAMSSSSTSLGAPPCSVRGCGGRRRDRRAARRPAGAHRSRRSVATARLAGGCHSPVARRCDPLGQQLLLVGESGDEPGGIGVEGHAPFHHGHPLLDVGRRCDVSG